jgi:Helix-turn-helix domain
MNDKADYSAFETFRERWQRQIMADSDLRSSYKLVCMAISLHFNRKENGAAWPGFDTLVALTGLCRSTIIRATKEAERRGYIRINRARKDNGGSLSNRYFALLKDEGGCNQYTPGVSPVHPGGVTSTPRG